MKLYRYSETRVLHIEIELGQYALYLVVAVWTVDKLHSGIVGGGEMYTSSVFSAVR